MTAHRSYMSENSQFAFCFTVRCLLSFWLVFLCLYLNDIGVATLPFLLEQAVVKRKELVGLKNQTFFEQ